MKQIASLFLSNRAYARGILLLLANCIVFCLGAMPDITNDGMLSGFFFFHFFSAIAVFIGIFFTARGKRRSVWTIMLLLLLISAYALNRHIPVFRPSVTWLSAVLVITGINFPLFHFWEALPGWFRYMQLFIMGMGMALFAYFAVYLLPLYPLSVIALIALGISLHTFVPIFLLIQAFLLMRDTGFRIRSGITALWAGGLAALLFAVVYGVLYNAEVRKLNLAYNRTIVESNGDLPAWVEASRQATGGIMEHKVLCTDLLYLRPKWEIFNLGNFPGRNFGEGIQHDPLIAAATAFAPPLEIPVDDRIKILESMYDARHEAQERLWSGDDLYTGYVNSKVKIWPKLHLAYTEKVLSVTNPDINSFRGKEAIYTFHLPEGGVVTSLSLWVAGKEEKAILTTKEKADTAYRTIVGVESRDPSLVRWQEGNTVSVRVFPVMPGESRKFRIGFTAPLASDGETLQYDNIYFDGPSATSALEDATVSFEGKPAGLSGTGTRRNGRYRADWKITMLDEGITPHAFSFNGMAYTLQPYQLQRERVSTDAVYVDANAVWTPGEFKEVLRLSAPRPVFVWLHDQMVQVSEENREECMELLLANRFSLFPLHRIKFPAASLLITKSTAASPSLADLRDSRFRSDLAAFLATPDLPKVRLLNIGGELSPYLKSLKEHRVFRYEKGGILLLKILLDAGTFAADAETADKVVIDHANVAITRQPADTAGIPSGAPDHLMRLFAYNHIMQQTGKGLITGSAGQEQLVAAAKEAYVVSPLSSLIVLETQRDYDRFGIKDEGSSLKNASLKSTGAVPEPHEWALIILVLLTLIYTKFRPSWRKANV